MANFCRQMQRPVFALLISDQLALWVPKHGGNMKTTRNLLALSFLAVIAAAPNASAQSLPAEGPLSVTFTGTQIAPTKPMPIGDGKEYTLVNWAMTASNDAGNPILNKMGGRCQLTRTTETSTKKFEEHGYCAYVDNDGDQIFEECDRALGAPIKCKLTGGSGKFNGLQADLDITGAPLKSNYDGIVQLMGQKKGTYKIIKTN
jgi:hypothetical protein